MIESAKAGRGGSSGGGWWVVLQKDAQEDGILNLFPETADNLIMLFPTESAPHHHRASGTDPLFIS